MSLDAVYIFSYDFLGYVKPTPIEIDIKFLQDKYGGDIILFDHGYSFYWGKPKYLLHKEDLKNILADQIFERRGCEMWEIIK